MHGFNKPLAVIFPAILLAGCAINTSQTQPTPSLSEATFKSELAKTQQSFVTQCAALSEQLTTQTAAIKNLDSKLAQQSTKKETLVVPAPMKCPAVATDKTEGKTILGGSEWVYISPPRDNFKARVDTGAAVSSINAVDVVEFERDGKKWVRFNMNHQDGGEPIMVERHIVRYANIRQASNQESIKRPVVSLNVRIGPLSEKAEFTLANRDSMSFPVLLGREFLKDVTLVDTGKEYTHKKYVETDKKKAKKKDK